MKIFKKKQIIRRNVTSTKDKRGRVFSYYSNKAETNGKPKSSRSSNIFIHYLKELPMFVALAAMLICLGYSLSLSNNPKVVTFTPRSSSGLLRSQTEYQNAAKEIMDRSLLSKTKITIDVTGFEQSMKNRFPELSTVAVTLPILGRRPIVQVQVATPALVLRAKDGSSFVVATSGKAIMPASSFSNNDVKLPVVSDQSGLSIRVGSGALTESDVSFITSVITQLNGKGITIESLTLPTIAAELQVKPAGLPYYIKFDLQGDGRQQAGAFLALKQKLDGDHVVPAEYVDVRVNEKAYYK